VFIPIGTCTYPYTPAIYFVLYTLSTVGLGDIPVNGNRQQWYAIFLLCAAMATNGVVIGKLVAILQRADIKRERRTKLRETLAVLSHFRIPKQLQEEILQFQAHVFEHNLGAAYEEIVSGLPLEMRSNISLFVKMKLISSVPMFADSHYMVRIAVAQSLDNAVARPEQYVIMNGDENNALYILAYGFADVFDAKGSYEGTLRSGDYFGDDALLGLPLTMSIKAITYCDLWVLFRSSFDQLMKRFPKLRRSVRLLQEAFADASQRKNPLVQRNVNRNEFALPGIPLSRKIHALQSMLNDVGQSKSDLQKQLAERSLAHAKNLQ
jgi:CRP-like cAMP-binding protein